MKSFTATQLNKSPQEVFTAAKEEGAVLIEHDRYNGCFAIVWNRQHSEEEMVDWTPADTSTLPEVGDIVTGPDGLKYECVGRTDGK